MHRHLTTTRINFSRLGAHFLMVVRHFKVDDVIAAPLRSRGEDEATYPARQDVPDQCRVAVQKYHLAKLSNINPYPANAENRVSS
jgi:hypothetical protein